MLGVNYPTGYPVLIESTANALKLRRLLGKLWHAVRQIQI